MTLHRATIGQVDGTNEPPLAIQGGEDVGLVELKNGRFGGSFRVKLLLVG